MNLPRADAALETCAKHLDASDAYGTEIEAILAAYTSAVIYSCFEGKAREIVAARAAGPGTDPRLISFARAASTRLMRSIKIGDLAGAAALFHADCKHGFHERRESEASNAWDTIVSNRHGLAHEEDDPGGVVVSNLTLRELKELYPKALTILECFRDAIS